jgi:RHS repeat-associated protein
MATRLRTINKLACIQPKRQTSRPPRDGVLVYPGRGSKCFCSNLLGYVAMPVRRLEKPPCALGAFSASCGGRQGEARRVVWIRHCLYFTEARFPAKLPGMATVCPSARWRSQPEFPTLRLRRSCKSPKTHTRRFSSTVSGYRYYSPALQRWVNRDPAGEVGGRNLYMALGNCPVLTVDPDGQIALPIVILNVLILKMPCILANYYAYKDVPPPPGYTKPVDAWKHCFVGCQIGRNCGLDANIMSAFGKEIMDWLLRTGKPEVRDILNTLIGGACSQVPVVACSDCCNTCEPVAR